MTPVASTHNRPRLKAIASSKGSVASSMLPSGSCRSLLVVATRIGCAGAAPAREKLTRRVARVQRITANLLRRALERPAPGGSPARSGGED